MSAERKNCTSSYQSLLDLLKESKNSVSFETLNSICDTFNYEDEKVNYHTYNGIDVCTRAFKKANDSYYQHTYEPEPWAIPLILENTGLKEERIHEIFDLAKKENCCNCIAIVLYSNGNINSLYNYLYSMKKTLDNVSNELSDFIVRFYLDKSVFETIHNASKEKVNGSNSNVKYTTLEKSFDILKYIIHHEQSEVVIYFCKTIIEKNTKGVLRRFRFLPMLEKDVNILISREADGFVSYNDCHNIRLFANKETHSIGMVYSFVDTPGTATFLYKSYKQPNVNNMNHPPIQEKLHGSYSAWLNIYSMMRTVYNYNMNDTEIIDYIKKKGQTNTLDTLSQNRIEVILMDYRPLITNLINILAGVFGTKIQFNSSYFNNTTASIKQKKDDVNYFDKYPLLIQGLYGGHNRDAFDKLLTMGSDEILLEELFYPFTAHRYPKDNNVNSQSVRSESVRKINTLFVLIDHKIWEIKPTDSRRLVRMYKNDPSTGFKALTEFAVGNLPNKLLTESSLSTYISFMETIYTSIPVLRPSVNSPISDILPKLNNYFMDLLFSRRFELKEKNKYYAYTIDLVNQPFVRIDEYDMNLYNIIYPQISQSSGGFYRKRHNFRNKRITRKKYGTHRKNRSSRK